MTPAEARALLAAAVPGPWHYGTGTGYVSGPTQDDDDMIDVADRGTGALVAAAPDLARAYLDACNNIQRWRDEYVALQAARHAAEDRLAALEAERIAHARGTGARIDGGGSWECPYPAESAEAVAWFYGWHAQDAVERMTTAEAERDELRLTLPAADDIAFCHRDPGGAGRELYRLRGVADAAEAARVDAVHAREMAESAIPAGVAVLDRHAERDALAAHVERLLRLVLQLPHDAECTANEADGDLGCNCGRDAALAATPASSLEAHDRGVRVAALLEAAEVVSSLEPSWTLSEDGAYVRAAGVLREMADAVERGEP